MVTLLIVPGSFAPASEYTLLTDQIHKHGTKTVVIDLPSVGRRGKGPQTMTDDANEICRVAFEHLDKGEEVVIMTHSYGGIPGTQSLERISHKARSAEGKTGVRKIIYMTSVIVAPGTSNFDLFGGEANSAFILVEDDYMSLDLEENAKRTFSDLPFEAGLEYAKRMLEHSTASFREKLTYPCYDDVEVHYILCEDDVVIPEEIGLGMIEMMKTSGGRDVNVHKLKSGHAPNISQPENVCAIVQSIVGKQ